MQSLEAKDFLVQETAEQAALEKVPFADLERRMMYFTENEEMREDPLKLNDEFEAEYDSDEYEIKVARLMHHAYARIKKENPEAARQWNAAIRELSKGDHYLPVLWQRPTGERPRYDSLKLLGAALLMIVVGGTIIMAIDAISNRYGLQWPKGGPETHSPMPAWLQRLLFGFIIGAYAYYVVLPWILKRKLPGVGELLLKLLRPRTNRDAPKQS
jgi:hypothetical protein